MKDIAVLFKPEMIIAIDENRKTQTRRLKSNASVGDRLWIKEPYWMWGKYRWTGKYTKTGKREMRFVDWTDDTHPVLFSLANSGLSYTDVACGEYIGYHARSPLFMPKKYARKWLLVTGVREERLQDISEDDAKKEGIPLNANNEDISNGIYLNRPIDSMWCSVCGGEGTHGSIGERYGMTEVECKNCDTDVKIFRNLWDSINADRAPWDSNPWVWVIEFERI